MLFEEPNDGFIMFLDFFLQPVFDLMGIFALNLSWTFYLLTFTSKCFSHIDIFFFKCMEFFLAELFCWILKDKDYFVGFFCLTIFSFYIFNPLFCSQSSVSLNCIWNCRSGYRCLKRLVCSALCILAVL